MAAPRASATSLENVQNLINIEDIQKAYKKLCKEEVLVEDELGVLLGHQASLESKMAALHTVLPNLGLLQNDSESLSSMIAFTSTLAENVSSKVRQLDLAKGRVLSCSQRVEDLLDLKFCTDGVQRALHDEDYEQAAAHIHRFLSLDENVLRMSEDISAGSTLDTSFKLLHESQTKLKTIVQSKFDAAVQADDVASVERFFKIFPLIGERDSGLANFSAYLSAQLADTADKNLMLALNSPPSDKRANVLYADTITMLFEGIARIVEIHQPLVETYYGPGRVIVLLQALQAECDRQARKIIENFKKNRDFDRKVQAVQQSFYTQKASANEKQDPRELDVLLAEVTLLNTRTELYLRFIKRRIMTDMEVAYQMEDARREQVVVVEQFLANCELSRLLQELIGSYIMMEEYFMREMALKAVNMDSIDDTSLTSSMVDDAFFIVKKCVRRALSSASVDGVCAMLNHASALLEQDFREVLYCRLRAGFPGGFHFTAAYNLVQSSFQQGKLQTADQETQKAKQAFLTTLNNAEVSCDFILTLKDNLEEEIDKLFSQSPEQSRAKLQSCLADLGSVSARFKDVLDFGFSQLDNSAIKPRVKPWVDGFLTTSHTITEEDFTNYEANDPWVQGFITNLQSLLLTFKSSLTSGNYDILVSRITTEVALQMEKAVMKTSFNRLGGLQYDKELRSLIGYLTSATTWTLRDKFARLSQIATILNLERVAEIMDYWGPNSGPLTWRLTPAEVRQVLSLRVDFRSDNIRRLKL